MCNFLEIDPKSIKAVVSKCDATIIYTDLNKVFVCTKDNPVLLPSGKIRYVLRAEK